MNGVPGSHQHLGTKEFTISVIIHGCLVALIMFVSIYTAKRPPEFMTLSLDQQRVMSRTEKPAGDSRKPGSEGEGKSAAKGALTTVLRKLDRLPAPLPVEPVRPVETVTDVPSTRTTDAAPAYEGIKGVGEGEGGGGGRGIGAYGTGSGFGGTGGDGTGGGRGKGAGGPSKKAELERYLSEHYQYIRDLIVKNLVYPPMARKMGWEGRVTVSFVISETGRVGSLKVVKTSGYPILDDNVIDTIREVQPFPRPPAPAPINIPIKYNLDRT